MPSALSDLAGTWTGIDGAYEAWVDVEFVEDGRFSGTDATGCGTSGSLRLLDAGFNLYEAVDLSFDCDTAGGRYAGFAYRFDASDGPGPGLFLIATNEHQVVRLSAYRLEAAGAGS